ncbi:MAG TPA: MarR family transcriptional regulator [Acidimicrobiales bacterium]|jgi:DNA-binding MarR family transcriptional regulator
MTKAAVRRDLVIREAWHKMADLVLNNERRREVFEHTGLSFGKMRALRRVAVQPMSMRELAEQLSVDPPNLTPIIDYLERLELVERQAHSTDRRVKLVAATPKGAALARVAEEILDRPPVGLVNLPSEELEILMQILARIGQQPEPSH